MSRKRSLAPQEIANLLETISPSNSEGEELSDTEDEYIPISEPTSSESDDDIEETRPTNSSPDIDEDILGAPLLATDTDGT